MKRKVQLSEKLKTPWERSRSINGIDDHYRLTGPGLVITSKQTAFTELALTL